MPLFGFKKHYNPFFNLQGNQGIEATILGRGSIISLPSSLSSSQEQESYLTQV